MFENKKKQLFDKAVKKAGLNPKEIGKFKNFGNSFSLILWSIAKFMAMLYIFNKVHARVGFEKTIITLLILITVLLRSNLKPKMIE